MIDFDELRGEVFKRHSLALTPDDPILVSVTLNELVLQRYLEMTTERYSQANRELLVGTAQYVEQAKATAGRVITDAADYVAKEMRQAASLTLADVSGQIRRELADAQTLARDASFGSRDAQTAKQGALIAAVIAGAAAVVALAAVVVVLVKG